MHIRSIELKNYRKFNSLIIEDMTDTTQILGQNDSGKTTVFDAIKKVLNPSYRNKMLFSSDSYNENLEDIKIKIELDATKLIDKRAESPEIFKKAFPEMSNDYTIKIELNAIYNHEYNAYDEYYFVDGIAQRNKNLNTDKFVEVVYIEPVYSLEEDFKRFVREKKKKVEKKNGKIIGSKNLKEAVSNLNTCIQSEVPVSEMQEVIDEIIDTPLLKENTYKIQAEMNSEDYMSSLVLNAYSSDSKVNEFGDGKRKMISSSIKLSTAMMQNNEKEIIYLFEEPENHLFIREQKQYLEDLIKNNLSQVLISTHSPFILNYKKNFSIVKLLEGESVVIKCIDNNFGYFYSVRLSEMFYYDKVICVEGYSEEIFYDYLSSISKEFRKYLIDNNIGIFNVKGIGFQKYVSSLEKFGIEIWIKTDNEMYKERNKDVYAFNGLNRALKYIKVDEENSNCFEQLKDLQVELVEGAYRILQTQSSNEYGNLSIEQKRDMKVIIDRLEKNNILVSNHFGGFEEDLNEFCEHNEAIDVQKLKEKKAENLYELLNAANLTEVIKEETLKVLKKEKTSKLLGFIKELS